jgi:signal transduction histidine kinase
MLTSILGNLVGNAIKYTPRGSVLVGCRRHGNRLSIQVADSGIGIGGERINAIFAPFHQEDPQSAGLGLGLAIVRRSADSLGHSIRVKSVVGRGSVFSISPAEIQMH